MNKEYQLIQTNSQNLTQSIVINTKDFDQFLMPENVKFFPYNSECINDYNWGCAWRAIQMVLYSKFNNDNEKIKFEKLFYKYKGRKKLQEIFLKINDLKQIPLYLTKSNFPPEEHHNNWAEPFICQLIMYDILDNSGELFCVNGIPQTFTPKELLTQIYDYQNFKVKLINHFTQNKGVVMIDNGIQAKNILGLKQNEENLQLIIGDPHINQDCQKQFPQVGIYIITLNENGKLINYDCKNIEEKIPKLKNIFSVNCFEKQKWMIYLPNQLKFNIYLFFI